MPSASLTLNSVGPTTATLTWTVSGVTSDLYSWFVDSSGNSVSAYNSDPSLHSNSGGSGTLSVSGLSPSTTYTVLVDAYVHGAPYPGSSYIFASPTATFTTSAQTYSVSYNAGGGSPTPSGGNYTAGTSLTVGAAPSLSGYTFLYWSASGGLSGAYAPGTGFSMPAAGVTFSAQWQAINTPPSWSDNVLSSFVVGAAYSDGVSATYSPTYSVSAGSLPAGISLNTSTGAITGTPTGATYSYSFTITATNSYGSVSASFSGNVQGMLSVYDGAAWNKKVMYVRNSGNTAWVAAPVYVYNGTSWIASS